MTTESDFIDYATLYKRSVAAHMECDKQRQELWEENIRLKNALVCIQHEILKVQGDKR